MMQNAAQAYGKVAIQTSSRRELEADLLLVAASRLQSVHDKWDERTRDEFDQAVLYNRKLWAMFHSAFMAWLFRRLFCGRFWNWVLPPSFC